MFLHTIIAHFKERLIAALLLGLTLASTLLSAQQAPFTLPPGLPPMSKEETEQMMQFVQEFEKEFNKLSPEEKAAIEKEAREILIQQGIDPDTLQPVSPQASRPTTPSQPVKPSTPQPIKQEDIPLDCSAVKSHTKQQVSCLMNTIISAGHSLQQKLIESPVDSLTIRQWLSALMFYARTINKPEHLERLASESFDALFTLLTNLNELLTTTDAELIVIKGSDIEPEDDPYALLKIPSHASNEQISAAYQKQMKEHDTTSLTAELNTLEPLEQKKQQRLIKTNKRKRAELTEAHERLTDTHLRKQIDRARQAQRAQEQALQYAMENGIELLYRDLQRLVNKGLLSQLEDFMSRYEPTQLARYQQMEAAEKLRLEEQRSHAEQAGRIPAPTGSTGPYPRNQQPSYDYYGSSGGSTPNRSSYAPDFSPSGGLIAGRGGKGSPQQPSGADGKKGDAAKKGSDKNKDKDKDKDDKDAKKDAAEKEADKKTKADLQKKANDPEALGKEFSKELKNVHKALEKLEDTFKEQDETIATQLMEEYEKKKKDAEDAGTDFTEPTPVPVPLFQQYAIRTQALVKELGDPSKELTDETIKTAFAFIKDFGAQIIKKLPMKEFKKLVTVATVTGKSKAQEGARETWETHKRLHKELYGLLQPALNAISDLENRLSLKLSTEARAAGTAQVTEPEAMSIWRNEGKLLSSYLNEIEKSLGVKKPAKKGPKPAPKGLKLPLS